MRAVWKSILLPPSLLSHFTQKKVQKKTDLRQKFYIRKSIPLIRPLVGLTFVKNDGRYNNIIFVQPQYIGSTTQNFLFTKKFSPIHSGTSFVFKDQRNFKTKNFRKVRSSHLKNKLLKSKINKKANFKKK